MPKSLYSCASGPEAEDYRFAAFLPFLHYKPAFATFNFCYPLYADVSNSAGIAADRERNISEWLKYMNNGIPRQAVHEVLYATSPSDFEALTKGERIMTAQKLTFNPFFRWLMMPEHKDAREYMRFAKYSEIISSLRDDPWEEDMIDDLRDATFIPKWRAAASQIKDKFIADRFSFQFLRFHFYFKDADSVVAEYERGFANNATPSVIKPWAEEYYAVAVKDDIKANYHFAQSFGTCDDKKLVCVMHFNREAVEPTLKLAKTDKERFNIWAIYATNDPGKHLETLEKLYRLEPANDLLEMLVAREINKLEDWILTPALTGAQPAVREQPNYESIDWSNYEKAIAELNAKTVAEDRVYLKQFAEFVNKIVREGKVSNKPYWLLAAAYTNFLNDNLTEAKNRLSQHRAAGTGAFRETADVLDLMIRSREGKFDAAFEKDLLHLDTTLVRKEREDERHHLTDQLYQYISYQYAMHGDFVRSSFISSNARSYWWMSEVPSMIEAKPSSEYVPPFVALLTKKDKTPYERFLTRNYPMDSSSYYHLLSGLGSLHLREYKFKEAYSVFNLVPDTIWNHPEWARSYISFLNQNPFVARPGSNHRMNAADTVTYSKKSFTARMIELERLIADPKTPNRDELSRQYADAHFAMTFYGNSWLLVRSGWSYTEIESYHIKDLQYQLSEDDKNYYGCRKARALYETLYNSTRNLEIKAHCAFMISRCDRNYAYLTSKDPDNFKYKGDQYLSRFFTEFKNTKTAKAAIAECGSRESFVYWTKRVIE